MVCKLLISLKHEERFIDQHSQNLSQLRNNSIIKNKHYKQQDSHCSTPSSLMHIIENTFYMRGAYDVPSAESILRVYAGECLCVYLL